MRITIDHLRAAGLSDTQILDVIEHATRDSTEHRREQWREAARNYRGRQTSSISSASSASSASSRHDDEIALSLKSLTSTSKEERKKERAKTYGSVCPTTFSPSEDHYAAGLRLGLGREVVDACAAQMRDWSAANSNRAVARKSDWSRAFYSWLGRHSKDIPKKVDPAKVPSIGERMGRYMWNGSRWAEAS